MNVAESAFAYQFFGLVAEHPLDGGGFVEHRALGVDHRQEVGRVLQERVQALLVFAPVQLFGKGDALQGQRYLRPEGVQEIFELPGQGRVAGNHEQPPNSSRTINGTW